MKKDSLITFSLIIAFFSIAIVSFAQEPYISLYGGYGFSLSSQNLPDFYDYESFYDSANYKQINVSFGKGINFGGAAGCMFNNYVGIEIGFNYLYGSNIQAYDKSVAGNSYNTYYSRMFRVIPTFVLTPNLEKVNPYAKFGIVFGWGSISLEQDSNDDGEIVFRKFEMNGGYAFGGFASVGVMVKLNERFSLFGACNMICMSYAPTKGELTEFTQNGQNLLPGLTTKEKETEYLDSYYYNYADPSPDTQPQKELKMKYPYGSFGISVGIRIQLKRKGV